MSTKKKEESGYHYIGSGLDNVWLVNGYEIYDTPYGEGVMISNAEGLHKVIGKDIAGLERPMTGSEFRFLRIELDMSQCALGKVLGVTEQAIANYEKGKGKRGIPKAVDVLLRQLYLEYIDKDSPVTKMVMQIVNLDNHQAGASFQFKNGRWYDAPMGVAA